MRRRSSIALPNFGPRRRDSSASSSSAALKDEIVKDIFHVGLVNLGNSCFYNTIVQSLSATQPLTDIIQSAPSSSPALQTLSPTSPSYNPDLDALPSPLPMTAALLVLLDKLDPTNNEDGTLGKKAFNPKSLLRQLSMKHEEYAEATQQDSHELLRHLIDGIMMEEQDLIKKLNALPPSHPSNPRRPSMHTRSTTVKAVIDLSGAAVVPEDAMSDSSASVHGDESAVDSDEESDISSSEDEGQLSEGEEDKVKKGKMRPFVGSVFEGKLASFIICDECKNVSLTKEDFMDLSLSLKDDTGNKMRKRDRIRRTLQAGFFSRKSGRGSSDKSGDEVKQAPNGIPKHPRSSLSETEASASDSQADETDEDHIRPAALGGKPRSRGTSLDPTKLTRDSAMSGLRPDSAAALRHHSQPGPSHGSRDPSPLGRALSVLSRGSDGNPHSHRRPKIPKPTVEQIAYIKQVLVDVPGPAVPSLPAGLRVARPPGSSQPSSSSPAQGGGSGNASDAASISSTTSSLARLRLANTPAVDWQNTDLFECFRQFTAVEVLEGENSFACRSCWKWLNPELEAKRKEDKERRRAERKLKRAARAQSQVNGSVTAAIAVDGEGNLLRPQDVARKELEARERERNAEEDELDSDEDDRRTHPDADRTARNTPAASPRIPTITSLTPDSAIPPLEHLAPADAVSSPAPTEEAQNSPNPGRAIARSFSVSSEATTNASVSTDYEGGVSSEAFETTTDEEDNDDSPDLDGRSLSGSVADIGASQIPLTVDNIAALPAPSHARLAVPKHSNSSSRPQTSSSLGSSLPHSAPPRPSSAASGSATKVPPKSQQHILRRAHKRYLISPADLPPVLVIHLKRFMQTSKSSLFGSAFVNLKKRDDPVTFPREMDLSPFLAPKGRPPRPDADEADAEGARIGARKARTAQRLGSSASSGGEGLGMRGLGSVPEEAIDVEVERENARYKLYAVVVHEGTIDTGHYASYVLTNRYGKGADAGKGERRWVFCSDEDVMAVSEAEVLRSKAYMLFYERVPSPTSGATDDSALAADSPKPAPQASLAPPPTLPDVLEASPVSSPPNGVAPAAVEQA
ncbi:hypothetical protein JCM10213_005642 [Rhodosporidiobolus nylandii]